MEVPRRERTAWNRAGEEQEGRKEVTEQYNPPPGCVEETRVCRGQREEPGRRALGKLWKICSLS